MTILDIHRRLVLLYEKVLRYGSVSFLEVNEIRDLENELAKKSIKYIGERMKEGDIVQVINKLSPYYGDIGNISCELDQINFDFEVFINPDYCYFTEEDLYLLEK